jgi:precorrin-6Y C5,15-methyltransferase (decarboxylating)
VFAGGTGGTLEAIVAAALAMNPNVRVVINAVTLETLALAHSLIGKYAHEKDGADIVQIGVSVAREAGGYRLLKAENPVFVISFGGAE